MTEPAGISDDSEKKSEWFQAPVSSPGSAGAGQVKTQGKSTESAKALVEKCLEEAREKQQAGDLRGAFLVCQSLIIDHFGNIEEQALATLYGFMGKISLLQEKQERAVKYLQKARALRPDDPEILNLIHDVVETQERVSPAKKVKRSSEIKQARTEPPTLKRKIKPDAEKAPTRTVRKKPVSARAAEPARALSSSPSSAGTTAVPAIARLAWVAGFWTRLAAFLVDTLVVTFVVVLMTMLSAMMLSGEGSGSFGVFLQQTSTLVAFVLVFILMLITYLTLFSIYGGQTAGKMLLGLKVVRLDGHSITTVQAFRRASGMLLAALPGLAGFFWAAFDINRRGWHDYVGKTLVVHIRQPDSEKTEDPTPEDDGSPIP
jgi:uncharacterized RDD family membrane protein YckC